MVDQESTLASSTVTGLTINPDPITTTEWNAQLKWEKSDANLGGTFNNIFGFCNLFLGLQAVVLNLVVVVFYLTAKRIRSNVVPAMYLMMSSCDMVTGNWLLLVVITDHL